MVSVERVCAFGSLPSEAPISTDSDVIHKSWPKAPSISIDGLTVRYRESLPPALRGVTITIAPGERIGIVGR
jgi:ABC-type multidrug transport system fused ATPase/permease subunit